MVVLWVGTNNHEHTADQVAGGILAIAQLLLSHLPKSKIIVLVSYLNHCLYILYMRFVVINVYTEYQLSEVEFNFIYLSKLISRNSCHSGPVAKGRVS